ncbi:MAG: hypothetical protein WC565_04900 [Parcubacteria group bacterium]
MSTTNFARFTINGTASEDANGKRGYDATAGETLAITLEANPSLSVLTITYDVYDSTKASSPLNSLYASTLTFVENGLKSIVSTLPNSVAHIIVPPATDISSYTIRATAMTAAGAHVFERLVCVRKNSLRMTVPAESAQYAQRGWSDAINELTKAVADGGLIVLAVSETNVGTVSAFPASQRRILHSDGSTDGGLWGVLEKTDVDSALATASVDTTKLETGPEGAFLRVVSGSPAWSEGEAGPTGATGSIWFPDAETAVGMRVGDFALHHFGVGGDWIYQYDGVSAEPFAGWNQVQNISGGTGPTGPGYKATSTTLFTPEGYGGTVSIATQTGLAYTAGDYIRVNSRSLSNCWSEGVVTSYSGGSLSWTDSLSGIGSYETDDWDISLAGPRGATGPSGQNHAVMGPWGASTYDVGATGGNWQYMSPNPMGEPVASSIELEPTAPIPYRVYVPRAGIITGMYASLEMSLLAAIVFTVYINSTAAFTLTIGDGDYAGLVTGLSIPISAGNILLIRNYCPNPGLELGLWAKAILNVTWT